MSPRLEEVKQTFAAATRPAGTSVTLARPRRRHGPQIYRDTFGEASGAVAVDKTGRNVCRPHHAGDLPPPIDTSPFQGLCPAASAPGERGRDVPRTGLQTTYYHQFDTADS